MEGEREKERTKLRVSIPSRRCSYTRNNNITTKKLYLTQACLEKRTTNHRQKLKGDANALVEEEQRLK